MHYQRWRQHGSPLTLLVSESVRKDPVATFWLHIVKDGPVLAACPNLGPCWMWGGNRTKLGYGHLSWEGKMRYTHVISWHLATGEWPVDRDTLHRCDNPSCCNPDHLFLGTHQDNMADRNAKGRQARGERSASARLTAEQVRAVRAARDAGATQVELAARFGISRRAIRQVISRQTWKHL